MEKIKVCLTTSTNIDADTIKNSPQFEFVDSPILADYIISQSTVDFPEYINKTVYIAVEPPLSDHRIWCYSNFDNFHTVITHNPNKDKNNQFPFTKNNEAQFFPTRADCYPFKTREDTTIKTRGVFYAGMRGAYEHVPDSFGAINITTLRTILGGYFLENFKDSQIIGIGWNNQLSKVKAWRKDKQDRIFEGNQDFVLALENTVFPNYLYEKIWDGIAMDKVTLYLGDPNIEEHIPTNCFIDLRKYVNLDEKTIDIEKIGDRLRNITQEEYDEILINARRFREKSKGKYLELSIELSKFLMERMINGMETRR